MALPFPSSIVAGRLRWLCIALCILPSGRIGVAAESAAVSGQADAVLESALRSVGIEALLQGVLPALEEEPGGRCEGLDETRRTHRLAQRRAAPFGAKALLSRFTNVLGARLDPPTLAGIGDWYASAAALAIARREADSASLDEGTVSERFALISAGQDWASRKALVESTLKHSRTALFLTRFHHGLDGIVAQAEPCSLDDTVVDTLARARADARRDEALVAFFIHLDLIAPTAVIYDGLPDTALQAYADFAASPTGRRWFDALVETMGETLDGARWHLSGGSPGNGSPIGSSPGSGSPSGSGSRPGSGSGAGRPGSGRGVGSGSESPGSGVSPGNGSSGPGSAGSSGSGGMPGRPGWPGTPGSPGVPWQ